MVGKNILENCSTEDLFQLTMESANSQEKIIRIFEVGSLEKIIGKEKAEICRQEFLKNKIQIKQLSNHKVLEKFTGNNEFVDKFWQAHYIDTAKFEIKLETLVFDDKVAIYTTNEPFRLLIIQDGQVASNYKQMFDSLWNN